MRLRCLPYILALLGADPVSGQSSPAVLSQPAAFDGRWLALPPPTFRSGHSAVFDPIRRSMIVYGGYEPPGAFDTWKLSLEGTADWAAIPATPPYTSYDHSAVYDPVRDRVILFGGQDGSNSRFEVWTLDPGFPSSWVQMQISNHGPRIRAGHSMVYDSIRDRLLVFGGSFSGQTLNEVWTLSLGEPPTWTEIIPSGTPPDPRLGHVAVFDAPRDRMIVFGGHSEGSPRNDTWMLSFTGTPAWTALSPAGVAPNPRWDHEAVHDPAGDRMLIFGGGGTSGVYNDTWALTLTGGDRWIPLSPQGPLPPPRRGHSLVLDSHRGEIVTFGGGDLSSPRYNDTWAMSLGPVPAWRIVSQPTAPSRREGPTAVYDSIRDRMVVFGGYNFGGALNDVWTYDLQSSGPWLEVVTTGPRPGPRLWHSAIFDPVGDRMVVYGGWTGLGVLGDVWALSFTTPPVWSQLASAGPAPAARARHTAVYDPTGHRVIVYGGWDGQWRSYLGDAWSLDLGGPPVWSQVQPAGTRPEPRAFHAAVYDPVGGRMIVAGGESAVEELAETWALSLGPQPEWALLQARIYRLSFPTIYDPIRERMIAFGGETDFSTSDWIQSLSLTGGSPSWDFLYPTAVPPPPRSACGVLYDAVRDRMIVFGGRGRCCSSRNDIWTLQWDFEMPVPVALDLFEAAWARSRAVIRWRVADRDVGTGFHLDRLTLGEEPKRLTEKLLSGRIEYEFTDDTAPPGGAQYRLEALDRGGRKTFHGPIALGTAPPTPPSLMALHPNPTSSGTTIRYHLETGGAVRISIFDVTGSWVLTLLDRVEPPGAHEVVWDGFSAKGVHVPSGLYHIVLVDGDRTVRRKLAVVR